MVAPRALHRRIALHPQRYAYRCDRHPEPVFGADRETPEETAYDWCVHDVTSHQRPAAR